MYINNSHFLSSVFFKLHSIRQLYTKLSIHKMYTKVCFYLWLYGVLFICVHYVINKREKYYVGNLWFNIHSSSLSYIEDKLSH